MNTYLLTWNQNMYNWKNFNLIKSNINDFGYYDEFGWSCGHRKKINCNDRLFLIRVGVEPKGIIGSGFAIPKPEFDYKSSNVVYTDSHWNENDEKQTNNIRILWDNLLNPLNEIILELSELKKIFLIKTGLHKVAELSLKKNISNY